MKKIKMPDGTMIALSEWWETDLITAHISFPWESGVSGGTQKSPFALSRVLYIPDDGVPSEVRADFRRNARIELYLGAHQEPAFSLPACLFEHTAEAHIEVVRALEAKNELPQNFTLDSWRGWRIVPLLIEPETAWRFVVTQPQPDARFGAMLVGTGISKREVE